MFGFKELNMTLKKAAKENSPFYAVVVVVSPNRKNFLIGKRKEDSNHTCPGGGAMMGENPKDAALREVFEESGIVLNSRQLRELPITYAKNGKPVHRFIAVLKEKQAPHTKNDPDKEVWQWKWLEVDERLPEPMDEPRKNTFNEARLWLNDIRKAEEVLEILEKSKKAMIGEVRMWGGQQYRKESDGQWLPVSGGGQAHPLDHKKMERKGVPVAEGKTSDKPGAHKLDASSLKHHLKNGSYSLVTSQNPEAKKLSDDKNKELYEKLKSELKAKGAHFHEVEGHYGGNKEDSLMVHHMGDITPQHIEKIGKKYGQESVIHSSENKHVMPFTHHKENEGKHHKGEGHEIGDFESDYSKIKGTDLKFRLNFDFNKLHDNEPKPQEAPDQLKQLIDTLKNRGMSKDTVVNALGNRGYDKDMAGKHWDSEKEETKKSIVSSEQAGVDINTVEYAVEEAQAEKSDWLGILKQNLDRVNFEAPEPNKEIQLEGDYLLSASQVEEGIYDGYVKINNQSSGDHGKVLFQIKKMTLPAMIEALKAKNFISIPSAEPEEKKSSITELMDALNAGQARNININIYKSLEAALKGSK